MNFNVAHQGIYSRSELILRTIFGGLYIGIPHFFLLAFVGMWGAVLGFVAFWVVLFTGKYPQSMFEYKVKLLAWSARLMASLGNLIDGYPALGLNSSDEKIQLEIPYPEQLSRGLVLVRLFFGFFYVLIPHGFALLIRYMATGFLTFLAWWVVLFTGSYPEAWHNFNVGTLRWGFRLQAYLSLLTDTYPAFSGKE